MEGHSIFVLAQKLKRLKGVLNSWNRNVFGNLGTQVREESAALESMQKDLERNYNDVLANEIINQENKVKGLLEQEESFWRQKSKVKWDNELDKSTKFFHALAYMNRNKSFIIEMENKEGATLTDQKEIGELIVQQFMKKLKRVELLLDDDLINLMPRSVTEEDNENLIKMPPLEEIKKAVFYLNPNSSPGPDGFTDYWDIVVHGRDHFIRSSASPKTYDNFLGFEHSRGWISAKLETPDQQREDSRVWRQSTDGLFTVGSAYVAIRKRANVLPWAKFLWLAEMLPRTLGTGWKILHSAMHTDEKLRGKNFKMASRCCICTVAEETQDHILFECSFAQRCWELIAHKMHHHRRIANREEMFIKCRNDSLLLQDLWKAVSISCLVAIWRNRNGVIYGSKKWSISSVMYQVHGAVKRAYDRSKKPMNNTTRDLAVLKLRLGSYWPN
ncbi:hypothetical protein IFM89_010847 [Coptis chinensis]|uniref:Reverse transcriptase zinc-binding domain-containing protein n=1 Tax=Coptis chinensis TaxID=261450 RepID=A0A835HZ01_9MAGN|nr:hypothetical protein IFM89_010847 [Coptis chinensis]